MGSARFSRSAARRPFAFGSLLTLAVACGPEALGAATYDVVTTAEDIAVNGNCTLREALLAAADGADHDLCDGDPGPDEIVLSLPDVYELDDGPIALSGRELWVHGDLDQPFGHTVIDLGGMQRFLSVSNGSELRLEHLTLVNGSASGRGGAVEAIDSDLTLRRVTITDSQATEGGGAVSFEAASPRTLDSERVELQLNVAAGAGGGLLVDLGSGGTVRLVEMRIVDNGASAPPAEPIVVSGVLPSAGAVGGGIAVAAAGTLTIELRHLELTSNSVSAAADAVGGGAWIFATGGGTVVVEDLYVVGNSVTDGTGSDDMGLHFEVHGPALDLRRLYAAANPFGGIGDGRQARIAVGIGTVAAISDVAVVSGHRSGLVLAANGGSCSLRATNLTVAGHNRDGLALFESGGCTLTVENSIAAKNAAWGFEVPAPLDVRITGAAQVSAETIAGGEPKFASFLTGDYRLASDSPARNAGVAPAVVSLGPFDVGHGPRVLEGTVDLGAYEFGALFADDFERGDAYPWSAPAP